MKREACCETIWVLVRKKVVTHFMTIIVGPAIKVNYVQYKNGFTCSFSNL